MWVQIVKKVQVYVFFFVSFELQFNYGVVRIYLEEVQFVFLYYCVDS